MADESAQRAPMLSALRGNHLFADAALLIAVLSAFGYCVAFAYETGYADHFGYPWYLISPTPSVIVTALAIVFCLVLGVTPLVASEIENTRSVEWVLFAFGVILVLVYVSTRSPRLDGKAVIVILALIAVVIWGFLFTRKARRPATRLLMGTIGTFLATGVAASLIGTFVAGGQKAFFFLPGKPDFAVVRMYGEVAIAVRYDFPKQRFVREFRVFKLGEKEMQLEHVLLNGLRLPLPDSPKDNEKPVPKWHPF